MARKPKPITTCRYLVYIDHSNPLYNILPPSESKSQERAIEIADSIDCPARVVKIETKTEVVYYNKVKKND